MTTRIPYDSVNKQTGKMLAQAINKLRVAQAEFNRVKLVLDAASYGSDWAAVEAEVGSAVGTGQTLWTLVSGADSELHVPAGAIAQLANLDQG